MFYRIHPVIKKVVVGKDLQVTENFEVDAEHRYMEEPMFAGECDVLPYIVKEIRKGAFCRMSNPDSDYVLTIWKNSGIQVERTLDVLIKDGYLLVQRIIGGKREDSFSLSYEKDEVTEGEDPTDYPYMDIEDITGTIAEAIDFIDRATVHDEFNSTNGLADRLYECITAIQTNNV